MSSHLSFIHSMASNSKESCKMSKMPTKPRKTFFHSCKAILRTTTIAKLLQQQQQLQQQQYYYKNSKTSTTTELQQQYNINTSTSTTVTTTTKVLQQQNNTISNSTTKKYREHTSTKHLRVLDRNLKYSEYLKILELFDCQAFQILAVLELE